MLRLVKIGIKYVFVALVVGSLFAYAMFQGGFVSWYLFYSVAAILMLMIIVTLIPFKVKEVRRIVSSEAVQAGGEVEVTVIVEKYPFQPFFS
ncbi:hypothetical protein [Bacillus sp. JCM 19034]|uniref:hypothetical protein n=1 Tax=Bacillus sp. JCM 19034 TaxID=1481928 RepID=UPI0007862E4C|nr:hypothetical protein [Bacillus sp. JCM 19034]